MLAFGTTHSLVQPCKTQMATRSERTDLQSLGQRQRIQSVALHRRVVDRVSVHHYLAQQAVGASLPRSTTRLARQLQRFARTPRRVIDPAGLDERPAGIQQKVFPERVGADLAFGLSRPLEQPDALIDTPGKSIGQPCREAQCSKVSVAVLPIYRERGFEGPERPRGSRRVRSAVCPGRCLPPYARSRVGLQ